MKESTYISDMVDLVDDVGKACDEACKKVLASKDIAARMLKAVVPEYKSCTVTEIIGYISDIDITSEPIDPDTVPPVIKTDNSEDSTVFEGKRFYDIKFTAKAPKGDDYITLIINIEAQKDFKPGYFLVKRGIYYSCRMVSAEYGTVFTGSDYDKLQKVYSIWVCTDPDKAHKNTITRYGITPEYVFGDQPKDENRDYDLLSVVTICLNDSPESESEIIRLLTTLFDCDIKANEKKTILEDEFGIKMTKEFNEEVARMCNVSEMYFEKGEKKGEKKGREEERAEIIAKLKASGMTDEQIAKILK